VKLTYNGEYWVGEQRGALRPIVVEAESICDCATGVAELVKAQSDQWDEKYGAELRRLANNRDAMQNQMLMVPRDSFLMGLTPFGKSV